MLLTKLDYIRTARTFSDPEGKMRQLGSRRVEVGDQVLGAGVDGGAAERSDREECEVGGGHGGEDRPPEQDAQRVELQREGRQGGGREDAEGGGVS